MTARLAWLAILAGCTAHASSPDVLVLRGGAVYTLDAKQPWASALVVEAGRIVYVGGDEGAAAHVRAGARVVDLEGRMVLPGFHDAHTHPMTGGMRLLRCSLKDRRTADEIYATVRVCASAKSGGEWLLGQGWLPEAFGARGPSRSKLDELVPDRPAFLTTEDGYTAWANTKALIAAGVDATGVSGAIEGDLASRVRQQLRRPTETEYREALKRSTALANSFGITSMFEALAGPPVLEAYRAADVAGELTVRVVAAQHIDVAGGERSVADAIQRGDRLRGRLFRADAAKIVLDGGDLRRHGAALLEPYADNKDSTGTLHVQREQLNATVRQLDAAGFLVHMHAMGDRAVRVGLDALEHAMLANGARDRRHQLAHVGLAHTDDIARFGRLAVIANFHPIWFDTAGEQAAALGAVRSRVIYPMEAVVAARGRVIASSDWPQPSMNPLVSIQAAITRSSPTGPRMSLPAMLAAYSKDAAWASREETLNGTLEAGKAADVIVLDRNLFEVEPGKLSEARVLLTMLNGKVVYRALDFAAETGSKD